MTRDRYEMHAVSMLRMFCSEDDERLAATELSCR